MAIFFNIGSLNTGIRNGRIKFKKSYKKNPFGGVDKPEPLKHALSGYWSRRITDEHRFVYKVYENAIRIAQLRYRY